MQTVLQMVLVVINFITIGKSSTNTADLFAASSWVHSRVSPCLFPFFFLPSERDNCFFPAVWILQLTQCCFPQQCGVTVQLLIDAQYFPFFQHDEYIYQCLK